MNAIGSIVIAILVFSLLIFIHELGHFTVAKLCGVRVNEFAIGMGPTLFQFGKGETKYAIRLLPIGGFVSMEGENDDSADEKAFCNKAVWKRILIVVAGAAMNVLLGLILLVILTSSQKLIGTRVIARFNEGAMSAQTGLQENDEVLKINGSSVFIDSDIVYNLLRDRDGVVDMTVRRDGKVIKLEGVAFETQEVDGVTATTVDFKVFGTERTAAAVLKNSFLQTLSIVKLVWTSLIDLLTGNFGLNQMSGPVGVTSAIGEASSNGIPSLMMITVFITINLGVFNLLPIPALDGGRLLFLLIEAVRRKPVNPKYEGYVHMAGFALLMLLVVFVTFHDIARLAGWS